LLDSCRPIQILSVPASEAKELQIFREAIEPTLLPPSYDGVRNFHIGCDVMTLVILWALQWRRRFLTAAK
jgi:hypothetical protein